MRLAALLPVASTLLLAQAPVPAPPLPTAADKVDLSTLDGMVKALYSTISGPKGLKRDAELQRSLFVKGARLAATRTRKDGTVAVVNMDIEEYIAHSFPVMETRGFFERELHRKVEQWGRVAHVWSAYESFEKAGDPKPFERGINTFQMVNDGKRWWITGIAWDEEEAARPLPAFAPKDLAPLAPAEAGSLDAFIGSLYGFISGPAGQKRDAAKIRALFHPDCRFFISGNAPGKGPVLRALSVEEFLARALPSWELGFFEQERARKVERWGNMAQVWTTYETRKTAEGPVFMQGINSLQMQWDGARWWVLSLHFQNADPGTGPVEGGAKRP
jgi:hypothetical protein